MAKLVIFGAGDIARLAHFYFVNDSQHEVVAFVVDDAYKTCDALEGVPVCTTSELLTRYPPSDHAMFVAISYARMNRTRTEKYEAVKALGYRCVTYVSSRCTYLSKTPPGDNCFILEDNTIQPFVTIGNNVTLWSGNHIGHDSVIEDHCFITSHVVVAGRVRVGTGSFIGINATVGHALTIAPQTLIGAGAIVMKSTRPHSVYIPGRTKLFPKSSSEIDL